MFQAHMCLSFSCYQCRPELDFFRTFNLMFEQQMESKDREGQEEEVCQWLLIIRRKRGLSANQKSFGSISGSSGLHHRPKMLPVCMMVVLLCLQSNALNIAQTYHLQVGYGDMVILPCNASTYLEKEEGALLWEAMGEDVAILQGEELRQADRFKGRFALPSEEHLREGEWSLELGYALLSDTDLYECIWQGRKTISTVWLQVSVPHVERSMLELAGDTVTLPCYIQMSRKQSPDDMFVWWTWNGNTIALFHAVLYTADGQ
ncbi:uncharacterized protein LOC134860952 [Eleginops maclovinus]|uniref:uncharacterized protein LOC134860952 n=1 Tax=Eleginops maclovinus TaxID=56733 RepID=UPI0030804BCC